MLKLAFKESGLIEEEHSREAGGSVMWFQPLRGEERATGGAWSCTRRKMENLKLPVSGQGEHQWQMGRGGGKVEQSGLGKCLAQEDWWLCFGCQDNEPKEQPERPQTLSLGSICSGLILADLIFSHLSVQCATLVAWGVFITWNNSPLTVSRSCWLQSITIQKHIFFSIVSGNKCLQQLTRSQSQERKRKAF